MTIGVLSTFGGTLLNVSMSSAMLKQARQLHTVWTATLGRPGAIGEVLGFSPGQLLPPWRAVHEAAGERQGKTQV